MVSTSTPVKQSAAKQISDTIGALHRKHYGRGGNKVKTYIYPEFVITVLEDCFTVVEQMMIDKGIFIDVRTTRTMFQDWMGPKFIEVVEEATGKKVRAFYSSVSENPNTAIEVFYLEQ